MLRGRQGELQDDDDDDDIDNHDQDNHDQTDCNTGGTEAAKSAKRDHCEDCGWQRVQVRSSLLPHSHQHVYKHYHQHDNIDDNKIIIRFEGINHTFTKKLYEWENRWVEATNKSTFVRVNILVGADIYISFLKARHCT